MARFAVGECTQETVWDQNLGLYWWKFKFANIPGVKIELKNLPHCCGMQVLHNFVWAGFYDSTYGGRKSITAEMASQMLQKVKKIIDIKKTGCIGAITNSDQAEVWNKALAKAGFIEQFKFHNMKSRNNCTFFVRYNPIDEG